MHRRRLRCTPDCVATTPILEWAAIFRRLLQASRTRRPRAGPSSTWNAAAGTCLQMIQIRLLTRFCGTAAISPG